MLLFVAIQLIIQMYT